MTVSEILAVALFTLLFGSPFVVFLICMTHDVLEWLFGEHHE